MTDSTALTKRTASSALMPPPPPPKRIKRPPKVLAEEDYTSALSHIIARDFFPGLLESEAQEQYLEALDSGDQDWIDDAGRRVQRVMTPVVGGGRRGRRGVSMTPKREFGAGAATPKGWRGETPGSFRGGETPGLERDTGRGDGMGHRLEDQEGEPIDLNQGLTAFQAKYTSEDNESFNDLLDHQNEKRRGKYGWLWSRNKLPSKQQIAQAASKRLITASSEIPQREGDKPSQAMILRSDIDKDDRPAMIDSARTNTNPRNGLMFLPEDLENTHPQHTSRAQAAQEESNAGPKTVAYASTRLPMALFGDTEESAIPPSPSISAIDAAIRGQPHPALQRHGAYATSSIAASSDIDRGETPRVNGFAFVDAEPTPSEIDVAERRTGALAKQQVDHDALLAQLIKAQHGADDDDDATPSGPNPFSIAPSSRREVIHHKMVDKTSREKRVAGHASHAPTPTPTPLAKNNRLGALQQSGSGRTPTPRFASSPRISSAIAKKGGAERGPGPSLTPAARALYEKIGRTPVSGARARKGEGGEFDGRGGGDEKGGWMPTPFRVRKAV